MGRNDADLTVPEGIVRDSCSLPDSGLRTLMDSAGSLPLIAAGSAALLVPIAFHPAASRAPGLRAALETTLTLFALAAAWLMRGQFVHSRRARDLLLFGAVATLGLLNLAVWTLPAALELHPGIQFAASEIWGQAVIAAVFAVAAFVPGERLVTGLRHPVAVVLAAGAGAVALAEIGGWLLARPLLGAPPQSLDARVGPLGHPLGMALVLGGSALLACAATGFPRRQCAELLRIPAALAVAATALAGASFYYLMPRSLYPGQVSPSEVLRVIAFALILMAALRHELHARARMTRAAALAERRRVARDLHDGLAQDLAFIAAHGPRIAEDMGEEHPVVVAARRALAISRGTISELSDPAGATAQESLDAVAHELRDRFDIAIAVDADRDSDLAPHAREQVSRIAREAIANAARHGGARNVTVSLTCAPRGVVLRVRDDGRGICADGTVAPEGFGLRSMRERAAALGGQLNVRQPRRGGTELEVLLP